MHPAHARRFDIAARLLRQPSVRSIVGSSLVAFLVLATPAMAATFHVGAGMDCDSNTLAGGLFLAALNGPGTDTIYIARDQSYTAVNLFISNQSVTLIGGVDDCSDTTPDGTTTLDGTGDGVNVVIEYRGNDATTHPQRLEHLEITNDEWGGLSVDGTIDLTLADTLVTQNHRTGVTITGPGASLTLTESSSVTDNTSSTHGGGIACSQADVTAMGSVSRNTSAFFGGGFYLDDCTLTLTGGGPTRVEDNAANQGAGIYATSSTVSSAGSARGPVRIQRNTADVSGGGIQALDSSIILEATWTLENRAVRAGGIYALRSQVSLSRGESCSVTRCSRLSDNTIFGGSLSSMGAGLVLVDSSVASIDQTFIEGNRIVEATPGDGRGSVASIAGESVLVLDGVVLRDNEGSELVFVDFGHDQLSAFHVTVTDNAYALGFPPLYDAARGGMITIRNSILDEQVRSAGSAVPTIDGLLLIEDQGLSGTNIQIADPQFRNRSIGDLRLSSVSPAIDASDSVATLESDISGVARSVVRDRPDTPIDFGAYEHDGTTIFDDDFESTDTSRWSLAEPGG